MNSRLDDEEGQLELKRAMFGLRDERVLVRPFGIGEREREREGFESEIEMWEIEGAGENREREVGFYNKICNHRKSRGLL